MKKLAKYFVVLLSITLVFSSTSFSIGKVYAEETNEFTTESPITSFESGEVIGTKTITSTIESIQSTEDETIKKLSSELVTVFDDGRVIQDEISNTITYKNDNIVEIDNDSTENLIGSYSISEQNLKTVQKFAEKFKSGEITYEEYSEMIKDSGITAQSTQPTARGGLSWVTYYSKNSYSGGYNLKAAKMNGIWKSTFNALMLDAKAVQSGTMIHRHNYVSSNNNVSAFMARADAISSARSTLNIDAVALMGVLGVAVLTVTTIIGAAAAAGPAAILAARMVSTSSSAHTDIARAYELLTGIRNISPM